MLFSFVYVVTYFISVIHFCRGVLWYSLVHTSTLFGYETLWSLKMHPFVCFQSKRLLIYPPYCLCKITLGVLSRHIWCCTISVSCSFAIVLMCKILLLLFRYTESSDISRARLRFFEGKKKIMLYTERMHFYHRYKVLRLLLEINPPFSCLFFMLTFTRSFTLFPRQCQFYEKVHIRVYQCS